MTPINELNPNNIQARVANMLASFGVLPGNNIVVKAIDNDIEKGEGSKGGKVIGHTRSGKPVCERHSADHDVYSKFNSKDHSEAAYFHAKLADKYQNSKAQKKRELTRHHNGLYYQHMAKQ
jgi:hypothetical protein